VEKSRDAKKTQDDQVKAFRKAARELGGDESDQRFKDALRRIAKHRPVASGIVDKPKKDT
jgi:hypothetical protein